MRFLTSFAKHRTEKRVAVRPSWPHMGDHVILGYLKLEEPMGYLSGHIQKSFRNAYQEKVKEQWWEGNLQQALGSSCLGTVSCNRYSARSAHKRCSVNAISCLEKPRHRTCQMAPGLRMISFSRGFSNNKNNKEATVGPHLWIWQTHWYQTNPPAESSLKACGFFFLKSVWMYQRATKAVRTWGAKILERNEVQRDEMDIKVFSPTPGTCQFLKSLEGWRSGQSFQQNHSLEARGSPWRKRIGC